jgi:hypothetical protein
MPSTSKSQQRLFGLVYAYKSGEVKSKDLNPKYADKVKELSKSMTLKELKKYASTKHKNLPEKVSENQVLDFKTFNESATYDPKELEMGKKIEMEHNDIWRKLDSYLESFNIQMPFSEEEFYELIAKAHLRELPDYYTRLKIMEKED